MGLSFLASGCSTGKGTEIGREKKYITEWYGASRNDAGGLSLGGTMTEIKEKRRRKESRVRVRWSREGSVRQGQAESVRSR